MKAVISAEREGYQSFAVILRDAPPFPDDGPVKTDVTKYNVGAANNASGEWAWVALTGEEKDVIGDAMLAFGADIDVWYWCTLFE